MKKSLILITLLFISIFANQCLAQVTDPLNQSSQKVSGEWSSAKEKAVTKKKTETKKEKNDNVIIKDSPKPVKKVEISNPCPEEISVEFVSLTGNKASQTVEIAIKYTNHGVNDNMRVRNFNAYNEEGENFSEFTPTKSYFAHTDVPIKTEWEIGKMLPSKNKKLSIISFEIKDCTIEMRDVPIDWR